MTTPDGNIVKFSATIKKKGINPYVGVPKKVSDSFNKSGYIPVSGRLNKTPIRANLVPTKDGYILYINGEIRKAAKVGVGKNVHLSLKLDTKPRIVPMPKELIGALNKNTKAKKVWESLPPSHQKEFLSSLNYLKTPEALKRNIKKPSGLILVLDCFSDKSMYWTPNTLTLFGN